MDFKKYQHVERFGTTEVEGIELGECFVFPKIDGFNGSVYLNSKGEIKAGSRNRELTLENDNQGFYAYVLENKNIKKYLEKYPTHRLFGEWLVPHSLKTYRDNAWKRFYIFDVCLDKKDEGLEYIPYNIYKPLLEDFNLDYIPPLVIMKNGNYEQFTRHLDRNIFLIQDGKGSGEGIVIKNYDFYNRFGRQIWAKIVTSEFKEKHVKAMGSPQINNDYIIEEKIIRKFCTEAFIEKEFAKIVNEKGGFSSKNIPELLGRVWHEFIIEESWNIIKHFKNPTINYKLLYSLVINRIKEVKQEVFC